MAIYVYTTATGQLVSYCPNNTDPVATLAQLTANGLTAVTGLLPLDSTHAWQASTKTVVVVAAPVTPQLITTFAWLLRFTPGQITGAIASTDTTIQQFLYALNHTTQIDLTTPALITFMAYLVTNSLLTAPQVAAIMTVPSSINGP